MTHFFCLEQSIYLYLFHWLYNFFHGVRNICFSLSVNKRGVLFFCCRKRAWDFFSINFFVKDDYKYLRRKPTDTYSGWLLKKDIMIKGTVSQFSACENGSDREMPLFAWYWNCCSLSTSH